MTFNRREPEKLTVWWFAFLWCMAGFWFLMGLFRLHMYVERESTRNTSDVVYAVFALVLGFCLYLRAVIDHKRKRHHTSEINFQSGLND